LAKGWNRQFVPTWDSPRIDRTRSMLLCSWTHRM